AHREVIDFVLDFYEHCDDCENARKLADMMRDEFAEQGGRKYLYQLFPKGPLSTIHHLIDLPNLGHQNDQGFGTSF
ncbi:MAG: TusE/DsrC/DsvC family sulfur relay protein, partial [Thiolinea sp.]